METVQSEETKTPNGCLENLGKYMIGGTAGLTGGLIGFGILCKLGIDINPAIVVAGGVSGAVIYPKV